MTPSSSFLARRHTEDALTGQTGSGQARLTPGGPSPTAAGPRERIGAPLSGSYLGPQRQLAPATRPSVEWQSVLCSALRPSTCAMNGNQPGSGLDEELNATVLTRREVPVGVRRH